MEGHNLIEDILYLACIPVMTFIVCFFFLWVVRMIQEDNKFNKSIKK